MDRSLPTRMTPPSLSRPIRPRGSLHDDATSEARSIDQSPKSIPREKLPKAVRLYDEYRRESERRPSPAAFPTVSPTAPHQSLPASTSAYDGSSAFANYGQESVLSFADNSSELVAFNGNQVKAPRKRSKLSPKSKAKAALIRHLGACATCRGRRVPCFLEHHDIATLHKEWLRSESDFQPKKPDLPIWQPDTSNYGNPYSSIAPNDPQLLAGLGQNPVLQKVSTSASQTYNYATDNYSWGLNDNDLPGTYMSSADSYTPTPSVLKLEHTTQAFPNYGLTTPFPSQSSRLTNVVGLRPRKPDSPSYHFDNQLTTSGLQTEPLIQLDDLKSELVAAAEFAFEDAYGPGPIFPSIKSALDSISSDLASPSASWASGLDTINVAPGPVYQDGSSGSSELAPGAPMAGGGYFTFPNSKPGNFEAGRNKRKAPDVKSARPNVNPSARVLRRLRCHFNAYNPHMYCANRDTGDKYHVCAKSGYLTIAHLKQHNKSHHTASRCIRCGGLFDKEEDRNKHLQAEISCQAVMQDYWPGIHQAININETIQRRIDLKLSADGFDKLPQTTKDALHIWVEANIEEYVGNGASSQERRELKNWYLIWLALFPGVEVPLNPFSNSPAGASVEDERFIQTFRSRVQHRMGASQMSQISPQLLNWIVDRLRETWGEVRATPLVATTSTHSAEYYGHQRPSITTRLGPQSQETGQIMTNVVRTPSTRFISHQPSSSRTTPITPSTSRSIATAGTRPSKRQRTLSNQSSNSVYTQNMNAARRGSAASHAHSQHNLYSDRRGSDVSQAFSYQSMSPGLPGPATFQGVSQQDMGFVQSEPAVSKPYPQQNVNYGQSSTAEFAPLSRENLDSQSFEPGVEDYSDVRSSSDTTVTPGIRLHGSYDPPWSSSTRRFDTPAHSSSQGVVGLAPHAYNPMVSGDDMTSPPAVPMLDALNFDLGEYGQSNDESNHWPEDNQ